MKRLTKEDEQLFKNTDRESVSANLALLNRYTNIKYLSSLTGERKKDKIFKYIQILYKKNENKKKWDTFKNNFNR